MGYSYPEKLIRLSSLKSNPEDFRLESWNVPGRFLSQEYT